MINSDNTIDLIIFDMDGLMFDTEQISYKAWHLAAKAFGFELLEDVFQKTLGTTLSKTEEILMAHYGPKFPFEAVKSERIVLSEQMILAHGVPMKFGLLELLNYLQGKHIKMAVATSTSRKRAVQLLALADVSAYFDYVLCGDEITHSKPDPEIFLKVADRLDCNPSKCIVLEDSPLGVLGAFNAGMIPIAVPDLTKGALMFQKYAHVTCENLLEVKAFLDQLL